MDLPRRTPVRREGCAYPELPEGEWILADEPDYGGFLRGRVATSINGQIIVVYCRPETLAYQRARIGQFLDGIAQLPIPVAADALVISDNGDIYGTIKDMEARMVELAQSPEDGPSRG